MTSARSMRASGPPAGGVLVVSRWDIHPCDDRIYLVDKWWCGASGRITWATPDERDHVVPERL